MPRPNKARHVLAEEHLARRIAAERDAKGWTNDGLAKRMTDAGCPMTGSAIFKIEKGEPRRRIVVDELVAFATVFGVPVEELLLPPEAVVSREVVARLRRWYRKESRARAASLEAKEAWEELQTYTQKHAALRELAGDVMASLQDASDDGGGDADDVGRLGADALWGSMTRSMAAAAGDRHTGMESRRLGGPHGQHQEA